MSLNLMSQFFLSLVFGMLLGSIFFGGLWLTVRYLPKARQPWLLFLVSSLMRTAITVSGFWFVGIRLSATDQWQRIVVCLLGFILARYLFTRQAKAENASVSRKLQ